MKLLSKTPIRKPFGTFFAGVLYVFLLVGWLCTGGLYCRIFRGSWWV